MLIRSEPVPARPPPAATGQQKYAASPPLGAPTGARSAAGLLRDHGTFFDALFHGLLDPAEFTLTAPDSAATHQAGPCREVPGEFEFRRSRGSYIESIRSGGLRHGNALFRSLD